MTTTDFLASQALVPEIKASGRAMVRPLKNTPLVFDKEGNLTLFS